MSCKDPKALLFEICQKQGWKPPVFTSFSSLVVSGNYESSVLLQVSRMSAEGVSDPIEATLLEKRFNSVTNHARKKLAEKDAAEVAVNHLLEVSSSSPSLVPIAILEPGLQNVTLKTIDEIFGIKKGGPMIIKVLQVSLAVSRTSVSSWPVDALLLQPSLALQLRRKYITDLIDSCPDARSPTTASNTPQFLSNSALLSVLEEQGTLDYLRESNIEIYYSASGKPRLLQRAHTASAPCKRNRLESSTSREESSLASHASVSLAEVASVAAEVLVVLLLPTDCHRCTVTTTTISLFAGELPMPQLFQKVSDMLHCTAAACSHSLFYPISGYCPHDELPEHRLFSHPFLTPSSSNSSSREIQSSSSSSSLSSSTSSSTASTSTLTSVEECNTDTFLLNSVASWLAGSPIVGAAVVANVSLYRLDHCNRSDFEHLCRSSLPSGCWLTPTQQSQTSLALVDSPGADFLLPTRFDPSVWKDGNLKLPLTLLNEILKRRVGRPCSLLLLSDEMAGAKDAGSDTETVGCSSLCLSLPHAVEALGTASGFSVTVAITADMDSENRRMRCGECGFNSCCHICPPMSPTAKQAEQTAALYAIWALEEHGAKMLSPANILSHPLAAASPTPRQLSHPHSLNCFYYVRFSVVDISGQGNANTSLSQSAIAVVRWTYLGIGIVNPQLEALLSQASTNDVLPYVPKDDSSRRFQIEVLEKRLFESSSKSCLKSVPIFTPSLSKQRNEFISKLIVDSQSKCWIDAGCGRGDLFSSFFGLAKPKQASDAVALSQPVELGEEATAEAGVEEAAAIESVQTNHNHHLKRLIGIDINAASVIQVQNMLQSSICASPATPIDSVYMFHGSLLDPPALTALASRSLDESIVTCIEVIEHLPSIAAALSAAVGILNGLHPKTAVFSTPNYEANVKIEEAAHRNSGLSLLNPPSTSPLLQRLREADHKFEFTRAEFRSWCDSVLAERLVNVDTMPACACHYELSFHEVGLGLPGMEDTGGATQMAVFQRVSSPSGCYRQPSLTPTVTPTWTWSCQSTVSCSDA